MTEFIAMTALSLGIILLSCYIFVNAVEQAGDKLNLHQGIIGSILAAVGTALPETIIPILAILVSTSPSAHEIGIGAIAGAPFMLATLAFFVTGASVIVYTALGKRTLEMNMDIPHLQKDLIFFVLIYGMAILTTFVHSHGLRITISIVLMLSYILYLKMVISSDCSANDSVEELYLSRFLRLPDNLSAVFLQTLLGLAILIYGSHLFIRYVAELSRAMDISPLILSIIITPIATELPEKMNSIIWIGKKKDTLALGNITGAMVFQSCFPVVFGILFTPWNLSGTIMLSALLAFGSALLVLAWITIFKKLSPFALLAGGILYASFLISVF